MRSYGLESARTQFDDHVIGPLTLENRLGSFEEERDSAYVAADLFPPADHFVVAQLAGTGKDDGLILASKHRVESEGQRMESVIV